MSPSSLRVVVLVVLALLDALIVWRLLRAPSRGPMMIDPLFWIDTPGFDGFEVIRRRDPVWYWGGVLSLTLLGLLLLWIVVQSAFEQTGAVRAG